ncbi:MAG: RpiB/LacA/LacB family sugar-phosphate isomerase [Minisyncoccia bacterium]
MIYLGSDHRGFYLKEKIKEELKKREINFEDLGYFEYNEEDDYADIAINVAEKVSENFKNRGIVLCGTGIGVCISSNKVKGIRAGFGINEEIVKRGREEDDINVLCLPADFLDLDKAMILIDIFLNTDFKNDEKYIRRIKKIKEYEDKNR